MFSKNSLSNRSFIRLLLKGYFLGTLASAVALHIAVAFIAPGGAGTSLALADWAIFLAMLFALGVFGLLPFALVAIASWPLHGLVFRKPMIAFVLAAVCGLVVGAIATVAGLKVGPGDFWSAPLVGLAYGVVWFLTVKYSARRAETTIA